MNLLAIDTCVGACSVSLYFNAVKTNLFIKPTTKSSNLILLLLKDVFKKAGAKVANLDGIIYTKGPGAFTGVRVCVGVAQGLSYAHNIPTLGFSTLEVMAFGAFKKYNANIAVAIDARINEVYWGFYKQQKIYNESLKKINEVDVLGPSFIGVGTGWEVYTKGLLKKSGVTNYNADFYPQASNLIDLGLSYYNTHKCLSFDLPMPVYLRNNVATKSLK